MSQIFHCLIALVMLTVIASCSRQMASVSNGNIQPKQEPQPAAEILSATPDAETMPTLLPTPERVQQINKDPASLARAFYEFYLDGSPTMEGNEVIFMRFLTPRFYDEAEKTDAYDPFLEASEGDQTWKDNIKVSDVVIRGNKATLNLLLDGKTVKWKAKLTLLKKSGTWKIDGINMAVP